MRPTTHAVRARRPPAFSEPVAPRYLGEGRLERGAPEGRPAKLLRIDATHAGPTLIERLLVGSYITGHDRVLVTAHGGLSAPQRAGIHRAVDRLLGMSVVADDPAAVEIQSFVDPGKHELPRLLRHVAQVLDDELDACHAALTGAGAGPLARIDDLEEEVDQLSLLMARQLLLSTDSARIAHEIDVESAHFRIGYRLVAKSLEVVGDLIQGVGSDLREPLDGRSPLPREVGRQLDAGVHELRSALERAMAAFDRVSVTEANRNLDRIASSLPPGVSIVRWAALPVRDRRLAGVVQRVGCRLDMALEMCVLINEVTINRGVEPETVAPTRSRVVLRGANLTFPPSLARRAVGPVVLPAP